jgi:hypothetical protein
VKTAGYSFCESINAGPDSPWHLRKLGSAGRKLGGGADTPALCGRTVSWDLAVDINLHHLEHCCQRCVTALSEANEAEFQEYVKFVEGK